MSFRTLQDNLREEGYTAALAGKPCDAPTRSEVMRAAWEIGWRAGRHEYEQGLLQSDVTIIEAMINALTFLEANGYTGGDVHDALAGAIRRLRTMHPQVAVDGIETSSLLAESLRKCTDSTSVTVREESK